MTNEEERDTDKHAHADVNEIVQSCGADEEASDQNTHPNKYFDDCWAIQMSEAIHDRSSTEEGTIKFCQRYHRSAMTVFCP